MFFVGMKRAAGLLDKCSFEQNGPPALALSLDRNHGLMRRRPRDPCSPLLDAASLRFVLIAGAVSAVIGGLLLITAPRYGYGLEASRTLLFLYATISQLLLAYSARRIITVRTNMALHVTVVLCLGLQLATVFVPSLRTVLGLELPDLFGLVLVAGAILLSWGAAEIYRRFATAREWLSNTRRDIDLVDNMGEMSWKR